MESAATGDGVYEATVAWLRGLPPFSTVRWGEDGVQPQPDVVEISLDISAEGAPPFMWIWTIDPIADVESGDDPLTMVVRPDVIIELTTVDGEAVEGSVSVRDADESMWPSSTDDRRVPEPGVPTPEHRLGWHTSTIDTALHDWAALHAGRPDLEWLHDPLLRTPLFHLLQDRLDQECEDDDSIDLDEWLADQSLRDAGEDHDGGPRHER